jgi:hypothetical protein
MEDEKVYCSNCKHYESIETIVGPMNVCGIGKYVDTPEGREFECSDNRVKNKYNDCKDFVFDRSFLGSLKRFVGRILGD